MVLQLRRLSAAVHWLAFAAAIFYIIIYVYVSTFPGNNACYSNESPTVFSIHMNCIGKLETQSFNVNKLDDEALKEKENDVNHTANNVL